MKFGVALGRLNPATHVHNLGLRHPATAGWAWPTPSSPSSVRSTGGRLRADAGRADQPFEVSVGGPVDVARWTNAGDDRLIVAPWARSREAVDGLRRLADACWG
ncbi:MAG: hypothetical protein M3R01_08495 [Actinomycetota bacterium]|nr:hypothetical protein [Actinomycetota bacterium]